MIVDRGSILLIVYSAFSAGVAGIWHRLAWSDITFLNVLCVLLLRVVMAIVLIVFRFAGILRGDRLGLLFCGSTKSLANRAADGRHRVRRGSNRAHRAAADVVSPDPVVDAGHRFPAQVSSVLSKPTLCYAM
jgi:hypothetical protein